VNRADGDDTVNHSASHCESPVPSTVDYTALARSLASDFARRADLHDEEASSPVENIQALIDSGYTAMTVPTRHGGGGASLANLCHAQEALAAGCASTAWMVNMHVHALAMLNLLDLPDITWVYDAIVKQGAFLTGGFSEPGVGGNWWFPTTRAEPVAGGYVLNGRKHFFTSFPVGTIIFLSAVVRDARGVDQAIGFLFPRPETGLRIETPWNACGMRASGSHSLVIEDLFIPERHVLGEPGQLPLLFMRGVQWAWCSFSSVFIGIAAAALDYSADAVTRRKLAVLHRPLAHLPGVQQRIASMTVKLAAARAALYAAAARDDAEHGDPLHHYIEMSAMKLRTTQLAHDIVVESLRVMGGSSYLRSCPLQRMYRDVTAGLFLPPAADVALEWGGKQALDIPILGEPRWGE
jgi:alkylation response protein AidB-like acyl-CoA dehydrogenase